MFIINLFKKIALEKKYQLYLALLILGLALLPFLVLSFYTHPFADDFWLTNIAIEKGSWQTQLEIRQTWSGRYFAMFLGSINPLVYKSIIGYKILPIFLICLNMASLYAFITRLSLGVTQSHRLIYTFVLQVLYLGFMPAISSGYYWMSSALNYQTALIFILLLATLLISYRKRRTPIRKTGYALLVYILLFAGIGCNELSMMLLFEASIILFIIDYWHYKRINWILLGFIVIALVSTLLVMLSPGNLARLQTHTNHSKLLYSLTYAFAVTINNTFNFLTSSPILPLTILFIPFGHKLFARYTSIKIPHPVITTSVLYLIVFQCFFIIYWNRGAHAPSWVQNFIYFLFLGGWFLNVGLCARYYQTVKFASIKKLPSYAIILLVSASLLLIFHNRQSNVHSAYVDWLSGEATGYNQELNARYHFLQNSRCQVCPVKALHHRPKTIFFREIPASNDWENTFYARYFGKQLLLVSE